MLDRALYLLYIGSIYTFLKSKSKLLVRAVNFDCLDSGSKMDSLTWQFGFIYLKSSTIYMLLYSLGMYILAA